MKKISKKQVLALIFTSITALISIIGEVLVLTIGVNVGAIVLILIGAILLPITLCYNISAFNEDGK